MRQFWVNEMGVDARCLSALHDFVLPKGVKKSNALGLLDMVQKKLRGESGVQKVPWEMGIAQLRSLFDKLAGLDVAAEVNVSWTNRCGRG